jgi:hypothetical protein
LNPARKGLAKPTEAWRLSCYNGFGLNMAMIAACPIQFDDVRVDAYLILNSAGSK